MDESLPPPETGQPRLTVEFRFLAELARVVAGSTDLPAILAWIVRQVTALLRADAGSIKLLDPREVTDPLHTAVTAHRKGVLESGSWPREYSICVMGHLLVHEGPVASTDLADDPRFPALRGRRGPLRAALAVPLRVGNRITGMLAVTEREPGRRWTEEEIELLGIVASSSAGVVEQARLRAESEALQQLERDLALARTIQMRLVPDGPLRVGAWAAHGRLSPARQVGGDMFDYFPIGEDRLAFAIADVAGKGVPAALLASNVQAELRAHCRGRTPAGDAVREVNRGILPRTPEGRFITLFYGELAPDGRLSYCDAGHDPPLLRRRDGSIERLAVGGIPLGLMADAAYPTGEATLGPGEALLLHSDGVTEARDRGGEEFGAERLAAWWSAASTIAAERVVGDLLETVERFRDGTAPEDDTTVLVVAGAGA